jgi:hypothetical protein
MNTSLESAVTAQEAAIEFGREQDNPAYNGNRKGR